jgi:hypothetical protein
MNWLTMPEVGARHAEHAAGRWATLTLFEQLGNVGSEVGRAIRAKEQNDEERLWSALERALELLDLTTADPRHVPRLKEIRRAREVLCDYLVGDNTYGSTSADLDAYFLAFALAARVDR